MLADDHPEVLEALRFTLDELGEVVGMVGDGQALVEAAQRLKPDIIIHGYLDAQDERPRCHSCHTGLAAAE